MERHIVVVAALHIGLSIVGVFFMVLAYAVIFGSGVVYIDREGLIILSIAFPLITGFVLLNFLGSVIGGIGLMLHKNWARILILIIAAIDLVSIPFGTAVAIYTYWVLLQPETSTIFGLSRKT